MTVLTVNKQGAITLNEDLLRHLGVQPGDKLKLEKLPDGRVSLHAPQAIGASRGNGSISDFIGLLSGKTNKVATLEEIEESSRAGWAGEVEME